MPARYAMLVFSNPLAGAESVYRDGYRERHIADVVAIPGVDAGRFYGLHAGASVGLPQRWGYLARYELADAPSVVLERIYAANGSGELEVPEWIVDVGAWIFDSDSAAADWLAVDAPTALYLGNVQTPGATRSRRLTDAGHPFDPEVPCPWPVITDAQYERGTDAPNAIVLTPLGPLVC
jgi:hypothetical protein